MNAQRVRRSVVCALALGVASLVSLAVAPGAQAASVTPVEPPSGATLYDPGTGKELTLRWKVGLDGCEPLNNTGTTFLLQTLDASGAIVGESSGLPDPPESGSGAGLFASAANIQRSFVGVGNVDGTPARYRWKATLYCTKIGQGTTVVESDWQEFRIFRNANAPRPGVTTPTPTTPTPTGPATKVPGPRIAPPIGRKRARIRAFLGWAPRNRPLPVPFTARQIPRPLTPPGGTIRNCARGPRGVLLVFRYSGVPKPQATSWAWTLDGRRIAQGDGRIGGGRHNLYHVWLGRRSQSLPNGVYTVSIRLGKRFFGSASVRRAC